MQKVIIIGAGPAGLTAADKLLDEKEKYNVTILEGTGEIGGISRTVKYNGNRMDIGGHRFFSKDPEVMKYWEELMPIQGENSFDDEELKRKKELKLDGPNPNTEDEVMLIRTRVSRIYFLKKFFDYPVSLKWKTLKNMGLLRTIKVGFSYLKAIIVKRKEKSLEDFYINRFGEELYKMFFKNYTERLWGRKASEISADWGAQRVKGVSINAIIKDMFNKLFGIKSKENTETSLIEQFWYPKFGPGQLWETLAARVEKKGGKILIHRLDKEGLHDKKISLTEYIGVKDIELEPDSIVDDNDIIHVGNIEFKIIHTPGHTKGSSSLYCEKEKMLFSGDTMFYGTWGRTDLPTSSFMDIMNSITQKLLKLPDDTIVYPRTRQTYNDWRRKTNL